MRRGWLAGRPGSVGDWASRACFGSRAGTGARRLESAQFAARTYIFVRQH
jgi:hypothetical protein